MPVNVQSQEIFRLIPARGRGPEFRCSPIAQPGLRWAVDSRIGVGRTCGFLNTEDNAIYTTSPCYRILFVEDHDDTRAVMTKLLLVCGHTVFAAEDHASALAAARGQRFDLLVADISLPDGNGLELLSRLRELYPINGIVTSAHAMASDLHASKRAGFAVHLTKPIDARDLCAAINQVMISPDHRPAERCHETDRTISNL